MNITLNGKQQMLETPKSIEGLLKEEGYNGKLIAVAINGAFLPKSSYGKTNINENDKIEIVAPMQGG